MGQEGRFDTSSMSSRSTFSPYITVPIIPQSWIRKKAARMACTLFKHLSIPSCYYYYEMVLFFAHLPHLHMLYMQTTRKQKITKMPMPIPTMAAFPSPTTEPTAPEAQMFSENLRVIDPLSFAAVELAS
jgi:hypothetical protein